MNKDDTIKRISTFRIFKADYFNNFEIGDLTFKPTYAVTSCGDTPYVPDELVHAYGVARELNISPHRTLEKDGILYPYVLVDDKSLFVLRLAGYLQGSSIPVILKKSILDAGAI